MKVKHERYICPKCGKACLKLPCNDHKCEPMAKKTETQETKQEAKQETTTTKKKRAK